MPLCTHNICATAMEQGNGYVDTTIMPLPNKIIGMVLQTLPDLLPDQAHRLSTLAEQMVSKNTSVFTLEDHTNAFGDRFFFADDTGICGQCSLNPQKYKDCIAHLSSTACGTLHEFQLSFFHW